MGTNYDFIPVYPHEVYTEWAQEQDERILAMNTKMWVELNIKKLREIHSAKMEALLALGDDAEDFSTFCKFSYIVHAYHKVLDMMVREEIDSIIADICK